MAIINNPAAVPVPVNTPVVGPTVKSPAAVNPTVASVPAQTPQIVPRSQIDTAPAPIPAEPSSTGNVVTLTVPAVDLVVQAAATPNNNVIVVAPKPGGSNNTIQFNNNGTFGGTPLLTWVANLNSVMVTAATYGSAKVGSILFKDPGIAGSHNASINYLYGGVSYKPGVMISPWNNSYNNQQTRHDAGLSVWRSTQTGPFQRTQTTINASDTGPSIHGVYIGDGALDFSPDYGTGNAVGLSYVILPAAFTSDGSSKRWIGQIAVNAYKTPGTPQWSLGWKKSSPTFTPGPAMWNSERAPGNRNIIWDANNHVSINDANLTQSLNIKGNVRIESINTVTDSGILFADGTYQYTAATGGGTTIIVKDEGTDVTTNTNALNFVGSGVTASNVGGIATITIPGSAGLLGIIVKEEGSNVVTSANTFNFVGTGVTASNVGGVATITIPAGISGITVKDEGANVVPTASILNFVGAGVNASNVGGVATVNIPGGGILGVTVKDENNTVVTANTFNFVGAGVFASNTAGVATISIPGGSGSGIVVKEEGTNVVTNANTINFLGSLVTASNVAGVATITVNGPAVQEEGSNVVASANTINFIGNLVAASNVAGVATVTVKGPVVQEEGSNVVTNTDTFNFIGNLVAASNVAGVATVTVKGPAVQEEGSNVVANTDTLNFVGSLVSASNVAGVATVTVNGPAVQDEGSNVVTSTSILNFVGSGVTASNVGGVATVTIPGGSSGDSIFDKGNVTGNTEIYLPYGSIQTCTMIGNTNFDITSVTSAKSLTLLITQGSGGNKFATFGTSNVKWAVGYNTLSTAAGAVDMVNMVNIGNVYYATLTVGYV